MARRRGTQRRKSSVPESFSVLGAALGAYVASKSAGHHHGGSCPHADQAATCLGHAFWGDVEPLVVGAIGGAVAGLVLGVLLLALVKTKPRSTGFVLTPPSTQAPEGSYPVAPELTDVELRSLRLKIRTSVLEATRTMGGEGTREEILRRALETGGFTTRELQAPPPRRHEEKHSRRIDYELSWILTNLKRVGLATNPASGIWKLTENAYREEETPLIVQVEPQKLEDLRLMPYDEYLRTPHWKQTRAAALVRGDHCCALDPTHVDRLEVHHRSYERLGTELPSDLIVLCHECHRRHHS